MVPRLFVKDLGTGTEFEFELKGTVTRIGRALEQNDLVLNDRKVSRQHAIVRQSGDSFVLLDLESGNGTLVNGETITEGRLAHKDVISIGDHLLTFYGVRETAPVQFDRQPHGSTLLLRRPNQIVPGLT